MNNSEIKLIIKNLKNEPDLINSLHYEDLELMNEILTKQMIILKRKARANK